MDRKYSSEPCACGDTKNWHVECQSNGEQIESTKCPECGSEIWDITGGILGCGECWYVPEGHEKALDIIARLQVDLHQTVVDCEKYKEALKRIVAVAESDVLVCEPTVFDIAREALADRP